MAQFLGFIMCFVGVVAAIWAMVNSMGVNGLSMGDTWILSNVFAPIGWIIVVFICVGALLVSSD